MCVFGWGVCFWVGCKLYEMEVRFTFFLCCLLFFGCYWGLMFHCSWIVPLYVSVWQENVPRWKGFFNEKKKWSSDTWNEKFKIIRMTCGDHDVAPMPYWLMIVSWFAYDILSWVLYTIIMQKSSIQAVVKKHFPNKLFLATQIILQIITWIYIITTSK